MVSIGNTAEAVWLQCNELASCTYSVVRTAVVCLYESGTQNVSDASYSLYIPMSSDRMNIFESIRLANRRGNFSIQLLQNMH